jgi:hypothetical protein
MKFLIMIPVLILLTALINGSANAESKEKLNEWLAQLPKPWTLASDDLAEVLPKFHEQFPIYEDRLLALAYWRLGTPYEIFNLGEEQEPDSDPVFRLDVSDCTSHILTTMALAESRNWQEARDTLINIHYKPDATGKKTPQYEKRWHYTADRLLHHAMTPHVSARYIEQSKLKTVSVHLNKKQDGSEFLNLNWSLPVTVNYIPNEHITYDLLARLPSMIGVAFVKASYFDMGIVMAHEGMLIEGKQLLHAGQIAQETVVENFMDYYFAEDASRFDGIMLFDLRPMQ